MKGDMEIELFCRRQHLCSCLQNFGGLGKSVVILSLWGCILHKFHLICPYYTKRREACQKSKGRSLIVFFQETGSDAPCEIDCKEDLGDEEQGGRSHAEKGEEGAQNKADGGKKETEEGKDKSSPQPQNEAMLLAPQSGHQPERPAGGCVDMEKYEDGKGQKGIAPKQEKAERGRQPGRSHRPKCIKTGDCQREEHGQPEIKAMVFHGISHFPGIRFYGNIPYKI